MSKGQAKNRRDPRAGWQKGLRVGVPLAVAVVLSVLFFVLLGSQFRRLKSEKGQLPPGYRRTIASPAELPYGSPTTKDAFRWPSKGPERLPGEFPRWNLKELPKGWNAEVAGKIHSYFESMTLDIRSEDEKLAELSKLRKELEEYLAQLGPEAVPTLAAILNAEGDFVHRHFVIDALGNLGPRSEEATFALRDFFMGRISDPQNRSELYHVVDAMGRLQNESSLSTLTEFIDNPDPTMHSYRQKFIEALGEHPKREEVVGIFVDHMSNTRESFHVRNKSAQALGKVRSPETLTDLYAAIDREPHWAAKQTMLGSVGKIGDPASIPFLEGQARNAQESAVRLSAAGAIRRIGTPYGWTVLQNLSRTEPDEKVRQHIETWLKEAGASTGN